MKNFGNKIKALRRKMNLTQEELAERLNISFQAISKWETNASLPDVTMLPVLANFFNVTTDELLGVDLAKKQAKIDEIIEEYGRLSNLGKEKEKFDFICQAYREYPNDYRILEKYMWMRYYDPYFWEDYWEKESKGELPENHEKVPHKDELLNICNRILNECIDAPMKYEAISMLSGIYRDLGNYEKAIEYIQMFPTCNREEMMEDLYEKGSEKWREQIRKGIKRRADGLFCAIRIYGTFLDSDLEKSIKFYKKAEELTHLIYDDGDYGFTTYCLGELYMSLSVRYCRLNDYENCKKYFELAFLYAKAYDELPETTIHSSFLIEGCLFKCSDVNSGYEYNFVKKHLIFVGKNRFFNRVRNEQWFKDIIEKYTPFAKDRK